MNAVSFLSWRIRFLEPPFSILNVIVFTFLPLIAQSSLSPVGFGFSRRVVNAVSFRSLRMVLRTPISYIECDGVYIFPSDHAIFQIFTVWFRFGRKIVNAACTPLLPSPPQESKNSMCCFELPFHKGFLTPNSLIEILFSFT